MLFRRVCLPVVAQTAIRGTLFTVMYEHAIDISEPTASAASLQYATHNIIRCAQIIIKRIKNAPLSSAIVVTVGLINDPISFCNCIFQEKPG